MKIGITFGGYCPLHQGHLDLIMRAKKENDLTFVAVCGYDGEHRGDDYDLPLIKRYRIIHNYLEDEVTKVIMVNDTELGIDESMSDENWKIWVENIKSQIYAYLIDTFHSLGNYIEYNWYVSEKEYESPILKWGSSFNSQINVVLMDRENNKVSGTLCRTHPIKYWSKITPPFRAYFSHNILISGTASEGKTILTRDIGKYFAIPYSYEKGRDNCAIKTDPEFNVKDFIYNIYEQHKYNEELICSPQNPGVFISDTDNMVSLMYAKAYSQREGFAINDSDYETLVKLADAYDETTTWNKIFLLAPKEKGIVDDGERYMPDSDFEIRKEFFDTLCKLYDDRGYPYEILSGNYYENFCAVRDYIKEVLES